MKAQLLKLWQARSPRDRIVLALLAGIVGAMLYVALLQSAYRARTQLNASVSALRVQAQRLEADASELTRVRAAPVAAAPKTDLRSQLQAQVGSAGLASSLVRMDARNANEVQVAFGSVPFADWLTWVAALQAQNIRVEAGRIEALSAPGMVSVTATLARAAAK